MRRVILLALFLSLFTGMAPMAQAQDSSVTLRVAMPALSNLDPVQISRFDANTRDIVENLFVGLTRFDPLTRTAEPMLAQSRTVSDDGLTWSFELRDDIHWVRYDASTQQVVDVRPVQAGDFVYAIQRACDPLRPSPYTENIMLIKGCKVVANAFHEVIDDLFIAREIGVRATGPYSLEIDLVVPSAYFPSLLASPELRPLAREAVVNETAWTGPDTIMTNGPFVLSSWTASGLSLIRNPFWPDAFTGNIEQVEVTFTDSPTQADMTRLTPEQTAAVSPDLVKTGPGNTQVMIGFSYDRALVNTTEIRRALALSLDRAALVNQLLPGRAQPLDQFTPPDVIAAPEYHGYTLNPTQAQSDFSAAGYPACASLPESLLLLVPDDDPLWIELANGITAQWQTQLGCNPALFEVTPLPRTLLIELAHSAYNPESVTRSHMWLFVWNADYMDANAWINDVLHCRYGYLRTGRECEAADALMDQAASATDPQARADLYAQAEEAFFGPQGTFPVIPLYQTTASWLQQPWLTGVNEYGPARYDLWTLAPRAE